MYRNICFTINNWTVDDIDSLLKAKYTYIICGFEVGAEGTPHIQGYMELKSQSRLSTIKKFMPRGHIEKRMGTQEEAIDYCKKDNNFIEDGSLKIQGKRNDLDQVRRIALEDGMRTITESCNFQQIRVAEKFLSYNEEPRNFKPLVVWIHGPTGTGKSKLARELCDSDDIYTKNTGTKWWDGYDKHECVIIDDFRPSWWDITYMLGLIDRYEFRVEFKGGLRQFVAKKIIITSAMKPEDCYRNTGEAIGQLVRRLDIIENLVSDVSEVGGVILGAPLQLEDNILSDL